MRCNPYNISQFDSRISTKKLWHTKKAQSRRKRLPSGVLRNSSRRELISECVHWKKNSKAKQQVDVQLERTAWVVDAARHRALTAPTKTEPVLPATVLALFAPVNLSRFTLTFSTSPCGIDRVEFISQKRYFMRKFFISFISFPHQSLSAFRFFPP